MDLRAINTTRNDCLPKNGMEDPESSTPGKKWPVTGTKPFIR